MKTRPSFAEIFMNMATSFAQRSTCRRLPVGCVITSEDNRYVLGVGYNGSYRGGPNDCDSDTPGACGCLHAEENAVINCHRPHTGGLIVYCTHLPCKMCAKRIVNLGGVVAVRYLQPYRLTDSLDIFKHVGIHAEQYPPERT